YEELYKINDEAGKRLTRSWSELPLRHTIRATPGDAYAADLNIFGRASLMQLIETVGTHMGEETLGRWLLQLAPPEIVRERQASAGESGFSHYADSFELLSRASFKSDALRKLQGTLAPGGVPAHGHMRRLHKLTTFVTPPSSQLYFPIQALTLWDVHLLVAFE